MEIGLHVRLIPSLFQFLQTGTTGTPSPRMQVELYFEDESQPVLTLANQREQAGRVQIPISDSLIDGSRFNVRIRRARGEPVWFESRSMRARSFGIEYFDSNSTVGNGRLNALDVFLIDDWLDQWVRLKRELFQSGVNNALYEQLDQIEISNFNLGFWHRMAQELNAAVTEADDENWTNLQDGGSFRFEDKVTNTNSTAEFRNDAVRFEFELYKQNGNRFASSQIDFTLGWPDFAPIHHTNPVSRRLEPVISRQGTSRPFGKVISSDRKRHLESVIRRELRGNVNRMAFDASVQVAELFSAYNAHLDPIRRLDVSNLQSSGQTDTALVEQTHPATSEHFYSSLPAFRPIYAGGMERARETMERRRN